MYIIQTGLIVRVSVKLAAIQKARYAETGYPIEFNINGNR